MLPVELPIEADEVVRSARGNAVDVVLGVGAERDNGTGEGVVGVGLVDALEAAAVAAACSAKYCKAASFPSNESVRTRRFRLNYTI